MTWVKTRGLASTSRHTLSSDRRLSALQRVSWIVCNLLNNAFPRTGLDKRVHELKFRLTEKELDGLWSRIGAAASPSRALCDLFWLSLPWPALAEEMASVNVLEVGCGSGAYGRLLEKCLGRHFKQYVGVDIAAHERWQVDANDGRFAFAVARAGDAGRFLPGSNLIVTQSALEHFAEDLQYFRQVADHVRASGTAILQVHLVPSASCITTFPWHGIREYTPRTLSKITRLFGAETQIFLFGLGGSRCNRIHRKFMTWPNLRRGEDLRHSQLQQYRRSVNAAIREDFDSAAGSSAFYALLLASHFRNDLAFR